MLPISAESRIVIDSSAGSSPGSGVRLWNSASAISATAPPPTPLNSATICGIAVIFTERAPTTPMTAPIAIAEPIQTKFSSPSWSERDRDRERHPGRAEQVPLARALRRREEAQREDEGHDRDQVEEIGRRPAHSGFGSPVALLEHLEHPVGDDEAADDVGGAEHDRAEADDQRRACPRRPGRRRGSRRRGRCRGSRSSPTSAACAASSAPSRSPRCRGRSRARGSSARTTSCVDLTR